MTEKQTEQEILDLTAAKKTAQKHKQALIERGFLPAEDEKKQEELRDDKGVCFKNSWE
jgi:hypothetical protein